jgi:hypothetical protein
MKSKWLQRADDLLIDSGDAECLETHYDQEVFSIVTLNGQASKFRQYKGIYIYKSDVWRKSSQIFRYPDVMPISTAPQLRDT